MLVIPAAIIAVAITVGWLYNKDHPKDVITPQEEKQTDSKASIEDEFYSSKDAKAVIEDFPVTHDLMDRWVIDFPPPPPIHPPCVTDVNPRRCKD